MPSNLSYTNTRIALSSPRQLETEKGEVVMVEMGGGGEQNFLSPFRLGCAPPLLLAKTEKKKQCVAIYEFKSN